MAIVQTGSVLTIDHSNTANAGTVSTTITVPADAEKVLVGVSGYPGYAPAYAGMTFTKGGVDTPMTKVPFNETTSGWAPGLFYMDNPDTGTNKTLKWDWAGAGASAEASLTFSITFWKGTDVGIRDGDGYQAASTPVGNPWVTPTLTAVTGDKIVAWFAAFNDASGGEGSVGTLTNLTLLANITHPTSQYGDGAWATGDPTGNTVVGCSTATRWDDGGVVAAVLTPAAAGPPPQQARPDADVTITGWSTSPLWSKVEEDPASDADFITATAS